ncbi:ZO2-like protein, partial [Mya arenaria]
VPGFGFGIAVSGGRDNPHFANGDPSIAISDVLKAGPAEGRLQINDRVLSVNGVALENVDHATAIGVLKESGGTVNLVIKRRIVLPASLENETPPLKITLAKRNRKDEYGLVLGCKYYIKEIVPNSLAAQEGGLKEGDTLNNSPIESLSLVEARKLLEKSKEKLQLIITKKKNDEWRKDDAGAYPPNSPHSRYDGRYIYDHEAVPPRPPLPTGLEDKSQPRSPSPMKDGYYSDREDLRRKQRYVGKRKDIRPEPRLATFRKDKEVGLGLRLAGGNSTGIFVASVQPGSGAEREGLTDGDHIMKANDKDIVGLTREEAVTYLTSLEGMTLTGSCQATKQGIPSISEPTLTMSNTLFRGVVGSWLAVRMGRNNQETQKGIIPNKNRAEQLAISNQGTSEEEKENSPSKGRGLLFKRKAARRSKSLSKDHWEDVIFGGFVRPVVIFGPLADVARERILKDMPDKFQSPQSEHHADDERKGRYNDQPPASPNEVEYSRPLPRQQRHQSPSNQQGQNLDPPSPGYSQLPSQQNHPPLPPPHNMYSDNSSYSSDSFSKYTSNPANKHDDSKLREKMGQVGSKPKGNDPYRFTRSTANKVNTSNVDKGKLSDLSAKFSPKKYHQSRNYHALSSRTDDELQKLKQSDKTHSKSSDHVASVHQTPDILKGNQTVSKSTEVVDQNHSNNHKRQGSHLETQHKNPNFSSYKKLITAGSYQSSKVSSKSQDEIRDPRELDINHMRGGSGSSQAGSAFESYNKASPLSTFGKNDSGAPRSPGKPGVDIKAMSRFDSNQDVDENHTVVATARGLFNNQGGVLESPETGVSIVIPSGALNGDQEQEIYFKVCRDNTILPPLDREKGETLLSPLVIVKLYNKYNNKSEECTGIF